MRRSKPTPALYRSVQVQSQTLAYIDTFMVLAVAAGLMFLLYVYGPKERSGRSGGCRRCAE